MITKMNSYEIETSKRILDAIRLIDKSKVVEIGRGVINQIAKIYKDTFGDKPCILIADENTYKAAGKRVAEVLDKSGIIPERTYVFDEPDLYAEIRYVERLVELLSPSQAIAIAIGSGTINDLVKLASYRCGRPYMTVVTAGSVDGYTAYGASISEHGFKQTFFCPAPQVVVIDLDVIAAAPRLMNAWGYADLMAKIPAGADWIIADALEIEAIDQVAWNFVQKPLRKLIANPVGVKEGDYQALCFLMEGLVMSGLAMQQAKSSRPASGAEHQFSHLWDNQHHTYNGKVISHGFKVAIGSLASVALYESLFALFENLSDERIGAKSYWQDFASIENEIRREFPTEQEAIQIIAQSRAKYIDYSGLVRRVRKVVDIWPDLQNKLQGQIIGYDEFRLMLHKVNAPASPLEIGISMDRLKKSYRSAWLIRERYTILDFTQQLGIFDRCIDRVFNSGKYW